MKKLFLTFCILYATCYSVSSQDSWMVTTDKPLQGDYYGITSANGQIGLVSSRSPLSIDKIVVGGLYDIYKGSRNNNFFPNINPLIVDMKVNGERISRSNVQNYVQSFCFKNAAFIGEFDYADKAHVQYTIVALRQMPFGFMMDVKVDAKQDISLAILNAHNAPESLRDPQDYFVEVYNKANPLFDGEYPHYNFMTTVAKSPTGRWNISATSAFLFPDSQLGGVDHVIVHRSDRGVGSHSQEFTEKMIAGDSLHFCVIGNIIADNYVQDVRNESERLTLFQYLEGYERLWARHNNAWEKLWQSDILVEGDAQAQQDIHSMLYHLYAFNREGSGLSCSPMGLSGLGYNGHSFWDADTWMFPALAILHPQTAVEMLNFRYDMLDGAIKKAYMHGYRGAMFPWQTSYTGQEETTPNNMYPSTEIHITGDVAIACWQYYCLTQDKDWLAEKGWPILKNSADFWTSRVDWGEDGRASLRNTIGADEWSQNPYGGKNINNNAYTIGVAKSNLQYSIAAAKLLGKYVPQDWQKTEDALSFDYLDNGVIAINDTYHGEVTKQADVDLLAFPLHVITDNEQIRKNLEYYKTKVPEKRTPAMSKSIYATLYCRLGDMDNALYYFRDSYLPNLNPPFRVIAEFNGGTNPYFITGAGGTLQSLLFGFAGLDITDKGLKQVRKAQLPPEWTSLTIKRAGEKDLVIK